MKKSYDIRKLPDGRVRVAALFNDSEVACVEVDTAEDARRYLMDAIRKDRMDNARQRA